MLSQLFQWLDGHPWVYWCLAAPATVWSVWRAWSALRSPDQPAEPRALWTDGLALLLLLLAWRWPFLLWASDYNLDESQLVAGALTLDHDPVFWRSVDGTTSGPLNFYFLALLHCLGLPRDFFTARLGGLLLIWAALWLVHRALAARYRRGPAWLAVLPAAGFFATVTHTDLLHYSSELVAIFLTSASAAALARGPFHFGRAALAVILAGAAPWAKLQAAPISALLVLWAASQSARAPGPGIRLRPVGSILLLAAAPSVVFLSLVAATGQLGSALQRYFFQNLHYVDEGWTLDTVVRGMTRLAMQDGRLPLFFATFAFTVLASAALCFWQRWRLPGAILPVFLFAASAVAAVLIPRRDFLHYALFLPVPFTLLAGTLIGGVWPAIRRPGLHGTAMGVLFLAGILPFATRGLQPVPDPFGLFAEHWRKPRSKTGEIIRSVSGGEGTLAVWGWAAILYVESGLPQGIRDGHTLRSIDEGPLRAYFRRDLLADFRRNRPSVFVDVTGPRTHLFTNRQLHGHEIFPELADEVRRHYILILEDDDARVYARSDLPHLHSLDATVLAHAGAKGRPGPLSHRIEEPSGDPATLAWRVADRRRVLQLEPPGRAEWTLAPNVRRILLSFGFDPRAYTEGTTNGAELFVELVEPRGTRPLFRRLLQPRGRMEDQGLHHAILPLPPFGDGAKLLIRTEPGEHGDAAWDWIQLARLELERGTNFHPSQFPDFNRVPSAAVAPASILTPVEHGTTLEVHAPAEFDFELRPSDQWLRFVYGLRPGAYSSGGATDGAAFHVEFISTGGDKTVLLDRHLNPATQEADRGDQRAEIRLPPSSVGDRLNVSISPGPAANGAWDWTYLRQLRID